MPHKHKRKRDVNEHDADNFNLAPNTKTKPLSTKSLNGKPILTGSKTNSEEPWQGFKAAEPARKKRKQNKSRNGNLENDTPKNFVRLMQWHKDGKKLRRGLDEGDSVQTAKKNTKSKKAQSQTKTTSTNGPGNIISNTNTNTNTNEDTDSLSAHNNSTNPTNPTTTSSIKILPNESLSTFSLRVDQSLPLHSSSSTNPSKPKTNLPSDLIPKPRLTKHNRRLQNVQNEWRLIQSKAAERKQRLEDEDSNGMEERREEENMLWISVDDERARRKGKKKSAVTKGLGDPWKVLNQRDRGKKIKVLGVKDVVQEPPASLAQVKNIFRERV